MAADDPAAKTTTGNPPALVLSLRVVRPRHLAAGIALLCLLACLWLAGVAASAQDKPADKTAEKPPDKVQAKAPEKLANSDCLDCHLDPTTTRVVKGKTESLVFPKDIFANSVHAKLSCIDCHTGVKELVHASPLPEPDCTGCHEKEAKQYASSIHGVSHQLGASGAAQCWDCHGSHGILPAKDPSSPVFKMNLPLTCAKCHSNAGLSKEYQMGHPEAASQYMESIHGQALLKMGLIVAPSCDDCHGVHDIKRSSRPRFAH